MRKVLRISIILGAFIIGINGLLFARQNDLLIDKLVEKDIITSQEAQQLKIESDNMCKPEYGSNDSFQAWIKDLKLSGDFRFRLQSEDKDTTTSGVTTNAQRQRLRARFRLGIKTKIDEGWTVKAGLATGSTDPRSTNQTFQDNFSSKAIQLDHAYAVYEGIDYSTIMAGKIQGKNILWVPSQLVWDSDINPEGIAVNIKCPKTDMWLNTGYFLIDEVSSGADPAIFYIQPGVTLAMDDIEIKGSFNYYATSSVKGLNYSNIVSGSATNTTETTPASFKYDYDCWGISAEIGKDGLIEDMINYGAMFFDYIKNPDPADENTGYLFGFKIGDKKVAAARQWQLRTTYRKLEKDAWLDFLTHSDFLGGRTDSKGYSAGLKYGLSENVSLGVTYYNTETIKAASKQEEELLQLDCNLKF